MSARDGPAQQHPPTSSANWPSRPRPYVFPGPEDLHEGWIASCMSTAKCDMCHRQRCGTIQKCIECKLSVCRPCATDGRLRGDPRHVMDPDDVEWESARMIRSRKMRQSRADAARRSREDEGFDEDWDDDLLMADAVGHRSLTPERYSAKSEVENAAEILVGMPGHTPDPIQNSVGQEEHFRLGPLDHSVRLPPVRSVADPAQSAHLPPLKTLQAQLGLRDLPPQTPAASRDFVLPRLTPTAYASQYGAHQQQDSRRGRCPAAATQAPGLSREPAAAPHVLHAGAAPVAPPDWCSRPQDHNHHAQAPHSLFAGFRPSSSPQGGGAYSSVVAPAGQPPRHSTPTVAEESADLKASACKIQSLEQPEWPLGLCLRVALGRTWTSKLAGDPNVDRRSVLCQLNAATSLAIRDLGLPDGNSEARAWIREQENLLLGAGAAC